VIEVKNYRKLLLLILLMAVVITPRLSGLNSFVTLDEPFWLSVGGNYYYALGQRELENTVYEYHPAVTTMSFVTAAFLSYFPEYRALDQGYFDVDKEKFDPFLTEHGKDPMMLLYISRLYQTAMIVLFALVIYYLLAHLLGDEFSLLVTALISSAPFFLGHSRVLSHEALVAFLVLASLFGLMAYLEDKNKRHYLFISAVSAAIAQLTKSSAMAMFPVVGLMLLVSVLENKKEIGIWSALAAHLKIFGIWFAVMALAYFVLWPGMWVAPGKMLYEVYGNAFSYAFQGARLQVTQELQPSTFSLASAGGAIRGFAGDIVWRGTPLGWGGFLLAIIFFFGKAQTGFTPLLKKMTAYLFVNAMMFILLFSLAQGRNSAHYIMTSHVSVDAIAALGWGFLLQQWGEKWKYGIKPAVKAWIAVLLVGLQLISAFAFYPYYYTYYNPLWSVVTGQRSESDYGEGMEQAAAYLAQKPNAAELKVFVFRGRGPFSYFFPGQTIIFNPLFLEEDGMNSMFERLAGSDYLVINDALAPRTESSKMFVQALSDLQPEHKISIDGISPILIYRVADIPPSFYETLQK